MKIAKKVIACAAVCAVFGVGVTAYAVGNFAENVPEPSNSSVEDTAKAETPDISSDEIKETETAESVPEESTVSAVDPERIPHVLPSKFAPEDLDLINTGIINWSRSTEFAAELNSEVYAAADGEVVYADYDCGYGNGYGSVVILKHTDDLYTLYGHLNPVYNGGKAFVEVGDTVKAGQCIGLAGTSGIIDGYGVAYACYSECKDDLFPTILHSDDWDEILAAMKAEHAEPAAETASDSLYNAPADVSYDESGMIIVPEGYCGAIVDADGNLVELIPNSQALSGGIRPAN